MRIDPWSSEQFLDYARLRDAFGIAEFAPEGLPDPPPILRRGIVFGHRGFNRVRSAILEGRGYALLTGLMPSGPMHLGHKQVIDQVLYYQRHGADVSVAVADIEAYATRGLSLEGARRLAMEEYVLNYLALGMDPTRAEVYFQSRRAAVKEMAYLFAKKVNLSEMQAIYGFGAGTPMSHALAPLIQVGDILHVQLERYGGPRPTLVPVGVDQDPHIRLTREIAAAYRHFAVTWTKDDRVGVFVRGNRRVSELLDAAEAALRGMGYADLDRIDGYKAVYIPSAHPAHVDAILDALVPAEIGLGGYGFYPPSSTYHIFMSGLTGGKMSSSKPESAIFLNDSPEEGAAKVRRAVTGGRQSAEEQRRLGGEPGKCSVYQMLLAHLIPDDAEAERIWDACRSGERLCGECKKLGAQLVEAFLGELAERRDEVRHRVSEIVADDPEPEVKTSAESDPLL